MTSSQAMVLENAGGPLVMRTRELPLPTGQQIVIRVLACAVCRTDLHLMDEELPDIRYPIIPGHQVVGEVVTCGPEASSEPGQLVGAAWLGHTCGSCDHCTRGSENLCDAARFHGYQIDGGFAQHMMADSRYCFPLEDGTDPLATAPLLCAGLIGYRAFSKAGDAAHLGIYGFGAAAHIVCQVAAQQGQKIYAFTREGDEEAQAFARRCGAVWVGSSTDAAPVPLDAALIFAPVGALVPKALRDVRKGGSVVCGGIHMSDIPAFPYADLWGERQISSVANLTREDGREFLELARRLTINTEVHTYPLAAANDALRDLREGVFSGSAVLVPG